ncbi:MAG: TolB family protein [Planctomycetota bacterium]|jgi:dipeptidyl aminopeptidase/acylaminoacyl peptidase
MTTLSAPRPKTRRKTSTRTAIEPQDLLRFALVSEPQIAPDGSRVVFCRKHVGKKNEYVTNLWMAPAPQTRSGGRAQTPEPRQFTAGEKDSHPRWSADGSRIAFIRTRDKKPQIFTIAAVGGEAVALTDLPEGSISTFKWSPDGRTIAVSFRAQDPDWTQETAKERETKGLSDPPLAGLKGDRDLDQPRPAGGPQVLERRAGSSQRLDRQDHPDPRPAQGAQGERSLVA